VRAGFVMDWIVDGEDVLLQVRASYSKRPGTLFVTSKRVAWYQSSASSPQISLPLTLLKFDDFSLAMFSLLDNHSFLGFFLFIPVRVFLLRKN
jgi:hypothetical protein